MKRRAWQGLTVALVLAAWAGSACGKGGDQASQSADSTARNLTLVPSDSASAALNDVPAPEAATAAPAPARQPAPAPKAAPRPRTPAAPASYTAAAGTRMSLAVTNEISSRSAKAGQEFTATVQSDVVDGAGHVVIPEGSTVTGTIVEVKPGGASNAGTLTLGIQSVTVRGTSYPLEATIESATTVQQGRGVTATDAAKVGAGAAAGAIAGRIIGKNTKGTVIGAVVGAAAGAGVARVTRTVDIVLPAGGHVEVSLTQPITVRTR